MISLRRQCGRNSYMLRNFNNKLFYKNPFYQCLSNLKSIDALLYSLNPINSTLRQIHYLTQLQFDPVPKVAPNGFPGMYKRALLHKFYSSPSRSFRKRENKRLESSRKPTLNEAHFQRAVSQLLPRFTPEELCNVITKQDDPLVCLELFNWASQQPRFKHDVNTYHITIKKLGVAKMYEEMDDVVNQVLAISHMGSEVLFNSIIYFFTEARKLTRAVNIYKHMKNSRNMECRPSIRTYNILFTAFLSRGCNSYINHMYMETIRCLFRQMVDDGIEPDIYSLNSMIKGYVLSLHVNDALRVFHQMGVVYNCLPNTFSYDYLIHGLCAQGRTNNAKQLCNEMKTKGFIPSSKSYNSLVNALALSGEIEEAVKYLWEMIEKRRSTEFITYRTVLDEICRQGQVGQAMKLLKEFQEKDILNGHAYRKLLYVLEDDYGDSVSQTQLSGVNKSAQLLWPSMYSAAPLPLAHAHVASSSSSKTKPGDLEDSLLQMAQEHHHASIRLHERTDKAKNDAIKKAACVAELLVEAMNGGVKELFSSQKQIELEIRALAATISRFIKQSDLWLSVTHSMNTAIKETGDFDNWMKTTELDSRSINAAIYNIHQA